MLTRYFGQLAAVMRREWLAQRWILLLGLGVGLIVPPLGLLVQPRTVQELRYLLGLALAGGLAIGLIAAWGGSWLVREPGLRRFDLGLPLRPSCWVAGRYLVFLAVLPPACLLAFLPAKLLGTPSRLPLVEPIARAYVRYFIDLPLLPWQSGESSWVSAEPWLPEAFSEDSPIATALLIVAAGLVLLLLVFQMLGVALGWRDRWTLLDFGAAIATALLAGLAWQRLADWHYAAGLRTFVLLSAAAAAVAILAPAWAQFSAGGVLDDRKHRIHSLTLWPILLGAAGLLAIYAHAATAEGRKTEWMLADFASSANGETWLLSAADGAGRTELQVYRRGTSGTFRLGPAVAFAEAPLVSPRGRYLVWPRCEDPRTSCTLMFRDLQDSTSVELPIHFARHSLVGYGAIDDQARFTLLEYDRIRAWQLPAVRQIFSAALERGDTARRLLQDEGRPIRALAGNREAPRIEYTIDLENQALRRFAPAPGEDGTRDDLGQEDWRLKLRQSGIVGMSGLDLADGRHAAIVVAQGGIALLLLDRDGAELRRYPLGGGVPYFGGELAPGRVLVSRSEGPRLPLPRERPGPAELIHGDRGRWQTLVIDLESGEVLHTLRGFLPALAKERGLIREPGIVFDGTGWPRRLVDGTWQLEDVLPELAPPLQAPL